MLIFLNFLSLTAVLGSLAYLTIGLTSVSRTVVALLAIVGVYLIEKKFSSAKREAVATSSWHATELLTVAVYGLAWLAGIGLLLMGRSDRPLITPWETVSGYEFLTYGIGTLCLIFLAYRRKKLPILFLSLHCLWAFSVFLIVYAIGYGFDPFIHEASIKAIETLGQIKPLTPYYLGQYSLVTIFHMLGGTIAGWSKILVPVIAACSLPWAVRKQPAALLLFLFPFGIFTITTPQNLAYLFLALAILLPVVSTDKKIRVSVWLFAIAAFFTQPIAGIPALLFAMAYSVQGTKFSSWLNQLLLVAYVLAVPMAFYLFTAAGTTSANVTWPDIRGLFSSFAPGNPSTENWWLNLAYLFEANRGWMYAVLAVIGIVMTQRKKQRTLLSLYGWPAIALLGSAVVTSAIDFHFLIEYERGDYPLRLLAIAGLFAVPLVLQPLNHFWQRLSEQPQAIRYGWYLVLAGLMTASLYLSYPRFDHYTNSHGYATSKADILAVRWINENAHGKDYIVLANQQVSAGALREFGFRKYYRDNLFYYPIPTGGPLYQYYLDMIEKPQQKTMAEAMELAGVKTAYFVLDEYWWQADRRGAELRLIADETQSISDGQVLVFRFDAK